MSKIGLQLLLLVLCAIDAMAHEAIHGDVEEELLLQVAITAPQDITGTNTVNINFLNEKGEAVPAMLTLARADSWQQVSLQQQFLPNELHPRRFSQRRQWQGKFPIHSSGKTELALAKGRYTLTAGKGLEYHREKITFEVSGGEDLNVDVVMRRWIDMPARGWWSGDPHVHVARNTVAKDQDILAAAMAEDIHVTSTLEMGDADKLHFPIYGRGVAGRVKHGNYWLVPGQEEPRTSELGHSIILNTSRLYRDTDNYYLYNRLFAQAREGGAVLGLAHYFYAKFHSFRAAALLLPDGLVDFVELLDNSDIFSPRQYYNTLNLGFKVPVSAGSDYPWGHHIGDLRTYVQLTKGQALTPEAWYQGLKAGRSFITQGPIINFSIDGRGIGSVLQLKPGQQISLRAQAQAPPYIGAAKHLSVISMGEEVASVSWPDRTADPLTLFRSIVVNESRWFVAVAQGHNGAMAFSSPIYVEVNKQPTRLKGKAFRTLLDKQIEAVHSARGDAIPLQHRSDDYDAWLQRIETYYLGIKKASVGELNDE